MTWPEVALSDVLELSIGGVWGKERGVEDTEVRVWRVTELKAHGVLDPSSAAYRSVPRRQYESRSLKPGDLLLEKSGGGPKRPVGRVGLVSSVPEPAVCANFMQLMRPRTDLVEPRFLHLYLNYFHQSGGTAGMQTATTNIRNIKASEYVQLRVPMPCRPEQRRIVDLLEDHLSRLDAADRGLALSLAKLKGLRERTMIHALTGVDALKRVDASLSDVGTSDGHLPSLPVGWQWARLGDVADVVGGITKDANKQNDPSFVEVPYLRVANVQRGHLKLDVVTQIRANPAKAKSLRLEHGDVLLNEGGDRDKLARGWVWEGQIAECIHQNHVFRARLHEPRLNSYFLSWTGNTFGGRWAELNGKQSVNLASISLRIIKQMPVIVPAAGEAERIAASLRDQLDSYDRLELALRSARHRAAALRRSLLGAAFSGRLTGAASDVTSTDVIEELVGV